MKSWITIASLLFLLCGLTFSSGTPGKAKAVNLRAITLDSLSNPLEARGLKKKSHRHKGSHKHKGGKDGDEDEDNQQSLDNCNNGTTCAECFGQGYVLCQNSDDTCYNPDAPNTKKACDDDDDDDDSAAASLFSGQSWALLMTTGALGLMTAML